MPPRYVHSIWEMPIPLSLCHYQSSASRATAATQRGLFSGGRMDAHYFVYRVHAWASAATERARALCTHFPDAGDEGGRLLMRFSPPTPFFCFFHARTSLKWEKRCVVLG